MAFTLEVIRGATTYNISNGNPFSIDHGDGIGGAAVRNIEESGPYQDGATHLSERLDPRTITLRINVQGASASALDGHRDTLMTIFKPVRRVPITLKLTRDDGTVRHIDTRRTGPLDIPLVKEHKPGHFHRGVVQLRAADPTWYDPDEEEVDFSFSAAPAWWTAGGSIPDANALLHVQSPSEGQAWGGAATIAAGSPWTFIIRSGSMDNTSRYAYQDGDFSLFGFRTSLPNYVAQGGDFTLLGTIPLQAGTHNYFVVYGSGTMTVYRGTVSVGTTTGTPIYALDSGDGKWRSDYAGANVWDVALPYAALYNIALSGAQRSALHATLEGTITTAFGTAVVYTGDVDSYPVIQLRGPITNPVITNDVTGDTLYFSGGTLGSSDVWTIDTRYGRKSITNQAGSSVMQYLSDSSDLASFRLVPAPLAPGGTQTISAGGGSVGTATSFEIAYYTRYLSY